jgi:hypothetical protein
MYIYINICNILDIAIVKKVHRKCFMQYKEGKTIKVNNIAIKCELLTIFFLSLNNSSIDNYSIINSSSALYPYLHFFWT